MSVDRMRTLAGVGDKKPITCGTTKSPVVTKKFDRIRVLHESNFRRLAKKFGCSSLRLTEDGLHLTATVTFNAGSAERSADKMNEFASAWAGTFELSEGHVVHPAVNSDEYPPLNGLEGPFRFKSGTVLYYDTKNEKYYNSKTDTFVDKDEVDSMLRGNSVSESDGNADTDSNAGSDVTAQNGIGYSIFVDGIKACGCSSRKHATAEALRLGKRFNSVVVASGENLAGDAKHKVDRDSKKYVASNKPASNVSAVKESGNTNLFQAHDSSTNMLRGRADSGQPAVKVPRNVVDAVRSRIAELNQSIAKYGDKGYNDESQKQKAIDALNKIMDNLNNGVDGLKQAQIYFSTLMSPITDLFPSSIIIFLANATNVHEGHEHEGARASQRVTALKQHIESVKDQMRFYPKDTVGYRDRAAMIARWERELARYEPVSEGGNALFRWDGKNLSGDGYSIVPVEKIHAGDYVKRKPDAKQVYILQKFDRSVKGYRLRNAEDTAREIIVKPGTMLVVGFTY